MPQTSFHPYLGPVIFFLFACLANTLFLSVVLSILSTTFAELNADAKAEVSIHLHPNVILGSDLMSSCSGVRSGSSKESRVSCAVVHVSTWMSINEGRGRLVLVPAPDQHARFAGAVSLKSTRHVDSI